MMKTYFIIFTKKNIIQNQLPIDYHQHNDTFVHSLYPWCWAHMVWYQPIYKFLGLLRLHGPLWSLRFLVYLWDSCADPSYYWHDVLYFSYAHEIDSCTILVAHDTFVSVLKMLFLKAFFARITLSCDLTSYSHLIVWGSHSRCLVKVSLSS